MFSLHVELKIEKHSTSPLEYLNVILFNFLHQISNIAKLLSFFQTKIFSVVFYLRLTQAFISFHSRTCEIESESEPKYFVAKLNWYQIENNAQTLMKNQNFFNNSISMYCLKELWKWNMARYIMVVNNTLEY